jgi:hypothetical protein
MKGFVYNQKLTALSQYNYLIYSERLNKQKLDIQTKISEYFYGTVLRKLDRNYTNYIIDFAVLESSLQLSCN